MSVFGAFGVLCENFIDTHLLTHREWHEGMIARYSDDSERRCQGREVMDSDRRESSTPAEAQVELLLMIHE